MKHCFVYFCRGKIRKESSAIAVAAKKKNEIISTKWLLSPTNLLLLRFYTLLRIYSTVSLFSSSDKPMWFNSSVPFSLISFNSIFGGLFTVPWNSSLRAFIKTKSLDLSLCNWPFIFFYDSMTCVVTYCCHPAILILFMRSQCFGSRFLFTSSFVCDDKSFAIRNNTKVYQRHIYEVKFNFYW